MTNKAETHDVVIIESQAVGGRYGRYGWYDGRTRYHAECRTCGFESVWEWYRGDIQAIADHHGKVVLAEVPS